MDKLIPLVVVALTGISYIAYKFPNAYRIIFIVLGVIYLLMDVGALAWNEGIESAVQALIGSLKSDKMEEAVTLARSYKVSTWTFLSGLILVLYLAVLQFLPWLLRQDSSGEK
jgi:glucan phosphoethanolaminetransferase (alkaline phosphatase superfamily)